MRRGCAKACAARSPATFTSFRTRRGRTNRGRRRRWSSAAGFSRTGRGRCRSITRQATWGASGGSLRGWTGCSRGRTGRSFSRTICWCERISLPIATRRSSCTQTSPRCFPSAGASFSRALPGSGGTSFPGTPTAGGGPPGAGPGATTTTGSPSLPSLGSFFGSDRTLGAAGRVSTGCSGCSRSWPGTSVHGSSAGC